MSDTKFKVNHKYEFTIQHDEYNDETRRGKFTLIDEYSQEHECIYYNPNTFNRSYIGKEDNITLTIKEINNGKLIFEELNIEEYFKEDLEEIQQLTQRNNHVSKIDFSALQRSIDPFLRDYQIKNKKAIYEKWKEHRSVMLQMPTGTGKTRLFVSIVKDIHNWSIRNRTAIKVLLLAHRIELIEQISKSLSGNDDDNRIHGIAHGKITANGEEQKDLPIQVASVQTLNRRLDRWSFKDFDFIIIDEAHHVKAKTYIKIIKEFPNAKILGVTATPYRMNGAPFRPEFDTLITSASVAEFIKEGWLSNYQYYSIPSTSKLQHDIDRMKLNLDGDYKDSEMIGLMDKDEIRAKIVDSYLKYASGKKGIVFTINKVHNEHVCANFNKAGIKTVAIDSETPTEERNKIVARFRKSTPNSGDDRIDVLCNVNIFSEGFDCPDVEFIQLARPTKSLAMYLQQVGRGLRKTEKSENVIILDNVGLYNKFGFPSAKRKWQYHFDGKYHNQLDYSEDIHGENMESERNITIITEGDEDVNMIHSTNEKNTPTEHQQLLNKLNEIENAISVMEKIGINIPQDLLDKRFEIIALLQGEPIIDIIKNEILEIVKSYTLGDLKFSFTEENGVQLEEYKPEFSKECQLEIKTTISTLQKLNVEIPETLNNIQEKIREDNERLLLWKNYYRTLIDYTAQHGEIYTLSYSKENGIDVTIKTCRTNNINTQQVTLSAPQTTQSITHTNNNEAISYKYKLRYNNGKKIICEEGGKAYNQIFSNLNDKQKFQLSEMLLSILAPSNDGTTSLIKTYNIDIKLFENKKIPEDVKLSIIDRVVSILQLDYKLDIFIKNTHNKDEMIFGNPNCTMKGVGKFEYVAPTKLIAQTIVTETEKETQTNNTNYEKKYIDLVTNLNRGRNGDIRGKALLIIAIIELIQNGTITTHEIRYTTTLYNKIRDLYSAYMNKRPNDPSFLFRLFIEMHREEFWKLQEKSGGNIRVLTASTIITDKSFAGNISHANLDRKLFNLIKHNSTFTQELQHAIVRKYLK